MILYPTVELQNGSHFVISGEELQNGPQLSYKTALACISEQVSGVRILSQSEPHVMPERVIIYPTVELQNGSHFYQWSRDSKLVTFFIREG